MPATVDTILDFVFMGTIDAPDAVLEKHVARWFYADRAFDRQISMMFGDTVTQALAGRLDHFAVTPDGRLALIVVLDQFPRNVFRDTPRAFAGDAKALALCREGIAQGVDKAIEPVKRHLFYLPLLHVEDRAAQALSVQCFEQLARDAPVHQRRHFEVCANAARRYRDVIHRFGRFPHRNEILGRKSTQEERDVLAAQQQTQPRYASLQSI